MKCDLHRADLPAHAFDRPLVCRECGAKIPVSAATTFEGSEYVRYFCGRDCLAGWCERLHQGGNRGRAHRAAPRA